MLAIGQCLSWVSDWWASFSGWSNPPNYDSINTIHAGPRRLASQAFAAAGSTDRFPWKEFLLSLKAQAARFRFSPDSGRIASSHRSATKSADARRGAAAAGELRQAAGAAIAARSAVKPRADVMIGQAR
jgi:hypothetical protein